MLGAGLLFSCADGTVPTPEMEKLEESESGSRAVLSAPQNLTVTQGCKREIVLTWDSVSKASRYYIYAADSLFSEYELIGESTKNTFTYSPLAAGVTKYLRVCSVDYEGSVSLKTEPQVGSTLAQPIISDITTVSGKEDSSLVVYWYMENAEFYKDELEYTIICKDADGKEVANSNVYASELESTSFVLDDLKPSESYVYTVTAFLSSKPAATEVSLEVDAETARRLRPNPPEDLAATEGTEKTSVTVSFKLPEKVDVLVAAKTYVQYPLYFKIYRRLSGTEDWGSAIVNHLYFTGATEKPADLDFESYDTKRTEDGYLVTWEDTSVVRGVKYDYKVQSYADNTTRIITSDLSSGETCGWAASIPKFDAKSQLTANEDSSAYTSAKISFDFDWELYGTESNWKYLLKTVYSADFNQASPTTDYALLESIDDIKAFASDYDLTDSTKEGYYKYSLIIVKAGDVTEDLTATAGNAFMVIPCATTFFLTSVINQPQLDTFALTDGYSSKNMLSWLYESGVTYELHRNTLDSDGSIVTDSAKTISTGLDSGTAGETFSYTDSDSVESGKIYSYTLYATITVGENAKIFPSTALTARTLGTPTPTFEKNKLAYDSISVTWNEVQKAESYEVALFNGETQLGETDTLDSEKIAELSTAGIISYKISNPAGYDDATISGKDLTLKVTAKDSVDSVESSATVRTMGPACISLAASKATDSSKITVTWNKTEGAEGYILQRVRYNIPKEGAEEAQRTDLFYVGSDGSVVYGDTTVSDSAIAVNTSGSVFTLSDVQNENISTNTGYESSQALISTGLPYEYTVLPVLSADDAQEVSSFKIQYNNVQTLSKRGSTHGFGHNVTATKAEYLNKIEISWDKPANPDELIPVLYKRKIAASDSDSDSSEWTAVPSVLQETTTKYTDSLSPTEANIYEYAVKYGTAAFSKAYQKLLASQINSLEEQDNRGYAFNMNYIASTGNEADFAEDFKWTPFDSNKRKSARATEYAIYVKNTNSSKDWLKIATLDSTGKRTEEITSSGSYDYNVTYDYTEKMANQMTIKPKAATAKYGEVTGGGSYDGILKVVRDPRHYYKIVMKGEVTADGSTYSPVTFDPSSEDIGDDMTVYACRQITDAELARAAMLALSYAFYLHDGGKADYSNVGNQFKYPGVGTITSDNGGSVVFAKKEAWSEGITSPSTWGKGKSSYALSSNYAPSQLTPGGNSATFVGISAGSSFTGVFRLRTSDDVDPYLYAFADEDIISIKTADASIPVDYSGEIKFTCINSDHGSSATNCLTLSVTRNGKTTQLCSTTNDNTLRKYYFPMQIWDNEGYEIDSSYYDWWED